MPQKKKPAKVNFGNKFLKGYFAFDDFILSNDHEASPLILDDMMIGLVTEETTFSSDFDGIIGLAYSSLAEPDVIPFFDKLMNDGLLKQNAFSFFLSVHRDESSELMLGGWDEKRHNKDIVWHPVINK